MLRINWRSSAAYRHARTLPAAGFAWEYLRRNEDYRHDVQNTALDSGAPRTFVKRWGLRFPERSRRIA